MSQHTQRITIQVGMFRREPDGEAVLVSQRAVDVDAEVYGYWAAHRTHGPDGGWSVTHVPSGMRAHAGIAKRDAIAVANALSEKMNAADVHEVNGEVAADIMSNVCKCDFCGARRHWNNRPAVPRGEKARGR
ncbi:MAG TPA: hypothetical protein VFO62_10765 [Candidatus Binatia bacterium]|nr:hypothetical protein [Candidatus Binatia bacterium]